MKLVALPLCNTRVPSSNNSLERDSPAQQGLSAVDPSMPPPPPPPPPKVGQGNATSCSIFGETVPSRN